MTESAPLATVLIAAGADALEELNPTRADGVALWRSYDSDGLRIRHISLDAGAVLPEHTAPTPVVITVVRGSVRFDIEGESHHMTTGGVIVTDAGVPHAVTALEPARLMLTLIG